MSNDKVLLCVMNDILKSITEAHTDVVISTQNITLTPRQRENFRSAMHELRTAKQRIISAKEEEESKIYG